MNHTNIGVIECDSGRFLLVSLAHCIESAPGSIICVDIQGDFAPDPFSKELVQEFLAKAPERVGADDVVLIIGNLKVPSARAEAFATRLIGLPHSPPAQHRRDPSFVGAS